MSSQGCSKDVLQQVNQFWSLLDDMSQNDPQRYQMFVRRQIKDGADFYSPPEPDYCLRTEILEPKRGLLYVNVCGWRRVPAAPLEDHSKPVPVCGGCLETHSDDGEEYSVVDVAFSPVVLQATQKDRREKEQIHLLALSFTQQQHGLRLAQHHTVASSRLKGKLEDMRRRLASPQQCSSPTAPSQPHATLQSPASLLQQISSMRVGEGEANSSVQLTSEPADHKQKKNFIQVISSSEAAQPQEPKYHLSMTSDPQGISRRVELSVELPQVRSMAECQLNISQDDVVLEVEDVYYLRLELPEAVNEDSASATFNKKTRRLTLKATVL
ncbi:PIH1 domain-containing protein 2 [Hypomesus transpacificus]|uniref:PIH1 domain-containing protein 2 n=1 Tax=Hypomesus transpacificus TaxID=137520 RepID=UPI001F07C12F|nr:PIH1 domain-containing protein 2 [Hypomesus transpacificus]